MRIATLQYREGLASLVCPVGTATMRAAGEESAAADPRPPVSINFTYKLLIQSHINYLPRSC